jgi:4'-phosphopantetheinyl transferase
MACLAALQMVDTRAAGEAGLDAWLPWLGEDELARYRRFVRQERRTQFVAGRVLLRQMLGQLLGREPRSFIVEERIGQAPLLRALPSGAAFSISHSGPWVACAVSAHTALGLDIEQRDPARDIAGLAAQAFDPQQQAWLAARPAHSRLRDFYQMWSEHEARIKLAVPAAQCTPLAHDAVSVVLCSARPLSLAPALEMASLPPF